jgi:hypothetical protein
MSSHESESERALHERLEAARHLANAQGHIAQAYAQLSGVATSPQRRYRAVRETIDAVDWIRRALEHMEAK